MKKLVLAGFTLTTFNAFAQQSATIVKVAADQQKLIVQNDAGLDFKIGDLLTVAPGCKLEVIQLSKKQALAKTELCADKSLLKAGVGAQADSNSLAQNDIPVSSEIQTNRTQIPKQKKPSTRPMIIDGFIVGLDVASLTSTTTGTNTVSGTSYTYASYPTSTSSTTAYGANVSYGYVPAGGIGAIGGLTILQNDQAQSYDKLVNFTALRAELNAAVGLPRFLYTYAGINATKFTDSQYSQLNPNMGWQVGAGAVIYKNFGLDLAYLSQPETANYKNVPGVYNGVYAYNDLSRNYDVRSIEVKATYTF